MDVHSYMTDWAVNYIKNKDAFTKKLEYIEKGKEGFDVHAKFKDKEQFVIVVSNLKNLDHAISKLNSNLHFMIIALNSMDNFKILIEKWKKLVEFRFLTMIFANPFSQGDKKWVIVPHTHHKICDEASLEIGLKSMFDMVDQIDEQMLLDRIKG